jgi:hypothetical protein
MRDVKRDEKDLVARAKRGEDQLTKASIPKIRVFSKVGTVYDKNGNYVDNKSKEYKNFDRM